MIRGIQWPRRKRAAEIKVKVNPAVAPVVVVANLRIKEEDIMDIKDSMDNMDSKDSTVTKEVQIEAEGVAEHPIHLAVRMQMQIQIQKPITQPWHFPT